MDLHFYSVQAVSVIEDTYDLGTVAPSSSDDIMLRVANTSDTYQAKDVTVTTSGRDSVQLWLSTDGETFSNEISVGNVAPGGFSSTFWLRRVTPSDATADGQAFLNANPAAWAAPTETD